jgi:hypothetical protein
MVLADLTAPERQTVVVARSVAQCFVQESPMEWHRDEVETGK